MLHFSRLGTRVPGAWALVACIQLGGCAHFATKPEAAAPVSAPDVVSSIEAPLSTPHVPLQQPSVDDPSCGWQAEQLKSLTLSGAIARAVCFNPRVADSAGGVRAEVAQHRASLSQFLPTVTASSQRAVNYSKGASTFGVSEDRQTGNSHSLAINWLVWDFGGRIAQSRAAAHTALAAMASEDAAIQAVIASTAEAYLALAAALQLQAAQKQDLRTAELLLDIAQKRIAAGGGTPLDVEFARMNLGQVRLAGVRLREQVQVARGELAATLNLDPDVSLQLQGEGKEAESGPVGAPAEIARLIRDLEAHPEVKVALEKASATEQQIAVIRSEMLPKISAVGNYYYGGRPGASVAAPGTRERFIGLSITFPVTGALTEFSRLQAVRAQTDQSKAQLEDTRRRVQNMLWKNWHAASSASEVIKHARVVEEHADLALKQAEIQYRNGAVDAAEWIRAHKGAIEAKSERIRAVVEARLSRVRLLLSLGRLAPWRLASANRRPSLTVTR